VSALPGQAVVAKQPLFDTAQGQPENTNTLKKLFRKTLDNAVDKSG
jgi:hypothetical protein